MVPAGLSSRLASGPGLFTSNPADPSQPGAVQNTANNPAAIGSIVQIFATGYANLDGSGAATQVFLAGLPAQVASSGTVAPGPWQINAAVPDGISGQAPVFVTVGGMASNAVTIYVK